MLVTFIAVVGLMLGSASIGFEAGKVNPDAKNIFDVSNTGE